MFPYHLKEVLPFLEWIRNSITTTVKEENKIEKDAMHVSMPPTFEARSYQAMWVFGNHIRVSSA